MENEITISNVKNEKEEFIKNKQKEEFQILLMISRFLKSQNLVYIKLILRYDLFSEVF